MLPTIKWDNGKVIMIDQRKLPGDEVYVECTDYNQVAEAIEKMIIRGAPAIGVAAAYGVAIGIMGLEGRENLKEQFDRITRRLERTRPTARNLFWALERMKRAFFRGRDLDLAQLQQAMLREAMDIEMEDVETNRRIGPLQDTEQPSVWSALPLRRAKISRFMPMKPVPSCKALDSPAGNWNETAYP
jgi:methylthioribose-1-phosphate isomerase